MSDQPSQSPNKQDQPQGFKRKDPGKALLVELESFCLFDQSQSSKWPRVTIYVEQAGGVDQYQDEAVIIYPNGRTWNLARAVDAPVAPEVVDVLYQSMSAVMVKDAQSGSGYSPRDVLRYPFRIVDAESVRAYEQWKKALLILRTVITETRAKPQGDGKVLHEVIARYLPDNQIEAAVAMIAWVKGEIEKKGAVAAGLRADAAA